MDAFLTSITNVFKIAGQNFAQFSNIDYNNDNKYRTFITKDHDSEEIKAFKEDIKKINIMQDNISIAKSIYNIFIKHALKYLDPEIKDTDGVDVNNNLITFEKYL